MVERAAEGGHEGEEEQVGLEATEAAGVLNRVDWLHFFILDKNMLHNTRGGLDLQDVSNFYRRHCDLPKLWCTMQLTKNKHDRFILSFFIETQFSDLLF